MKLALGIGLARAVVIMVGVINSSFGHGLQVDQFEMGITPYLSPSQITCKGSVWADLCWAGTITVLGSGP